MMTEILVFFSCILEFATQNEFIFGAIFDLEDSHVLRTVAVKAALYSVQFQHHY